MPRYAAFLRAVNLGRNRRISGAELRTLFEDMGFEDVASFRTSGNVVFDAERKSKLGDRIEASLAEKLGYEVPIYLRTASEVLAIADHEPFDPKLVEGSEGKLQVILLPARPTKPAGRKVFGLATDEDLLAVRDRELYWLPSGGTLDSALDRKTIDELVGPTTMRTKGTVEQLAGKYF